MSETVDSTLLRQLQLAELEIAKRFVSFCDRHDLRYFMIGGTFLGAVRHKGFIPWDDDMDFTMYREDYERFLQLCKTEPLTFEVHNFSINEAEAHGRYHTKLEIPIAKVQRRTGSKSERVNVWIDVLPLDGMPSHAFFRTIWCYYLLWRRATYKFSVFSALVNPDLTGRPFVEKFLITMGKLLPVEKIFSYHKEVRKLDKALKKYSPSNSSYVFYSDGLCKSKVLYKKAFFGEGSLYELEGFYWRGPQDKDGYLTQLYGDYMTPPPASDRTRHCIEDISFSAEIKEPETEES